MLKILTTLLVVAMSSGCAYSIKDIDISNLESSCVRECSKSYSSCVSQGNQVGFKTETLRACQESYIICTNTCPEKQNGYFMFNKIIIIVITVMSLVACQNNTFESCVEFYEAKAKRDFPDAWRVNADKYVIMCCKVSA